MAELPASCTADGQTLGSPNVVKVPAPPAPPIPTPLVSQGQVAQATKTSTKVKLGGMPAVIETSEIKMTQGDEPGTAGGVISGKNMDKAVFKKGSSKVEVEGKGLCYSTCMVATNGANANVPSGNQIAPSQTMVMVAQ